MQDDAGGLQAFSGGDWIDVPPQGPDVLVCNLGECAQMASAGYLLATPHRVLAARGERVSVPFFYNPALSATVRPLELPASLPWEREEDAGEVEARWRTQGKNAQVAEYGAPTPSRASRARTRLSWRATTPTYACVRTAVSS